METVAIIKPSLRFERRLLLHKESLCFVIQTGPPFVSGFNNIAINAFESNAEVKHNILLVMNYVDLTFLVVVDLTSIDADAKEQGEA